VALCSCSNAASGWSLLALALRIGSKLGSGCEDPSNFSAFDLGMRRGLWFSIGVLDSHTSLDRGTILLMTRKDFGNTLINCNDADLVPGQPLPQHSDYLMEMIFSITTHQAVLNQRNLLEPANQGEDQLTHWARKLAMVSTFELDMWSRYSSIDMDSATPIEKLIKLAADYIAMTAHLLLRRPPYKQKDRFSSPYDDFDILGTVTEVLLRDIRYQILDLAQWA
jgi:hypothetical protein